MLLMLPLALQMPLAQEVLMVLSVLPMAVGQTDTMVLMVLMPFTAVKLSTVLMMIGFTALLVLMVLVAII